MACKSLSKGTICLLRMCISLNSFKIQTSETAIVIFELWYRYSVFKKGESPNDSRNKYVHPTAEKNSYVLSKSGSWNWLNLVWYMFFSLHQVRDTHLYSYFVQSRHNWLTGICLNKVLCIFQEILASPFLFLHIRNCPGNCCLFPQTACLFVIFAEEKPLEPFHKQTIFPSVLFAAENLKLSRFPKAHCKFNVHMVSSYFLNDWIITFIELYLNSRKKKNNFFSWYPKNVKRHMF